MSRNLKALGLVLVAVFAMSALVAQAAQGHKFKAGPDPDTAILTGSDETGTNDVFTATGKIECKNVNYEGTQEATEVESITLHPEYTECTAAGQAATVTTTGCAYKFGSATDASGHASVEVECEAEKGITVDIPGIHVLLHVFPQTVAGGGVHYTNLKEHGPESKEAVTVEWTASKINVTCTGGPAGPSPPTSTTVNGGNCFLFGKTGTYVGKDWITGYEDKGGSGGTTPSGMSEGAQVDLRISAGPHKFKSDSDNERTILTGEDEPGTNDVITTVGNVECQNAVYQGTMVGNEKTELTIHPTYSDCTGAGALWSLTTNDCAYIFTSNTDVNGHAPGHIECASGNSIETSIPSLGVVLKIGEQTPEGGVHYGTMTNHPAAGDKEAVTFEVTTKNIAVKCFSKGIENGGNCFAVPKTVALSGKDWFTGYEDKSAGATNGTTPTETVEGARVNFTVV